MALQSPELIKAEPLTCQADVWSIGSLLYRMLSGQNVFQGMEGTEILQYVLAGKRQSLDNINGEMVCSVSCAFPLSVRYFAPACALLTVLGRICKAAIIRRCWLDNPLERPTMPELVALLASDLDESDQSTFTGTSYACVCMCALALTGAYAPSRFVIGKQFGARAHDIRITQR